MIARLVWVVVSVAAAAVVSGIAPRHLQPRWRRRARLAARAATSSARPAQSAGNEDRKKGAR